MNCTTVKSIFCDQGALRAVRFSVDGEYCVTCSSNRRIKLWNPYKGVLLKTYSGHADEVMDAISSCDSSQIISGGLDKSVILWDVSTGTPTKRLRGHASAVTTVRFNEESTMVVSGSRDNSVMCWDLRAKSYEPVQTMSEAKDAISAVRLSGYEILTASFDTKIRRYDIRAGQYYEDCIGEPVTCVNLTRDEQCTIASSADGILRLMDKDTGELLGEFLGLPASDLCIESGVDYKDTYILSGSADGRIWIWELATQKVIGKLSGDKPTRHASCSIAVHPQKHCFLATNGTDLLMWNCDGEKD